MPRHNAGINNSRQGSQGEGDGDDDRQPLIFFMLFALTLLSLLFSFLSPAIDWTVFVGAAAKREKKRTKEIKRDDQKRMFEVSGVRGMIPDRRRDSC
jgi:hypothetical protein